MITTKEMKLSTTNWRISALELSSPVDFGVHHYVDDVHYTCDNQFTGLNVREIVLFKSITEISRN